MTLTMKHRSWQAWLAGGTLIFTLLLLLSAGAMLFWPWAPGPAETRPLVTLDELPVGQPYPVEALGHFRKARPLPMDKPNPAILHPYPVPVFLFRDKTGDVHAFYGRDPRSGCDLVWVEAEQRFIDACHGSTYESTGEYVRGPAVRNLDQFGVLVGEDGSIEIDLDDYRPGPVVR